MADDSATIQARLTQLYKIRDTGVFSVRSGEDSTQFRSLEELQTIIDSLEAQMPAGQAALARRRPRYIRQVGKGL